MIKIDYVCREGGSKRETEARGKIINVVHFIRAFILCSLFNSLLSFYHITTDTADI